MRTRRPPFRRRRGLGALVAAVVAAAAVASACGSSAPPVSGAQAVADVTRTCDQLASFQLPPANRAVPVAQIDQLDGDDTAMLDAMAVDHQFRKLAVAVDNFDSDATQGAYGSSVASDYKAVMTECANLGQVTLQGTRWVPNAPATGAPSSSVPPASSVPAAPSSAAGSRVTAG